MLAVPVVFTTTISAAEATKLFITGVTAGTAAANAINKKR